MKNMQQMTIGRKITVGKTYFGVKLLKHCVNILFVSCRYRQRSLNPWHRQTQNVDFSRPNTLDHLTLHALYFSRIAIVSSWRNR